MIDLGLTVKQWERLDALLVSAHFLEITVQLLTLNHENVGDLTKRLLSGQVDIDRDGEESTRSCTMELLDPFHELGLDSDYPEDGSLYFTRMVKVIYSVISIDGKEQFDIPLFTGPLTKVERNGFVISCTAMGKEKMLHDKVWKSKTFKPHTRRSSIISYLLAQRGGETKLDLITSNEKHPKKLVIDEDNTVWQASKGQARAMGGKQLFYDGRGFAVLRARSTAVVYTFRQKGALLSPPSASYNSEEAINCVHIIGGKPKKANKKIQYRLVAPRTHPLSPYNLGRTITSGGREIIIPRYMPLVIEDSAIRSLKEAKARAKKELAWGLMQSVDVAFDSMPIPYLEEGDVCKVVSDLYSGTFEVTKLSIPLTAKGPMSIGYLKMVTPSGKAIQLKNRTRRKKSRRDRS